MSIHTIIRKINKEHPDPEVIREAGGILRAGGLVAFPTETVYGLGADALNEEAAKKIYAAKGRPSDNPLIIHITNMKDLERIVTEIPETAKKVAESYWPGPLTMIFEKAEIVPYGTTGGLKTVAVRMPDHPVARAVIDAGGGYIAAPSANTSGRPSPTCAEHVAEDLSGRIEMIVDAGPVDIGVESTILDMTVDPPMILRPGAVTREMLEELIGPGGRGPDDPWREEQAGAQSAGHEVPPLRAQSRTCGGGRTGRRRGRVDRTQNRGTSESRKKSRDHCHRRDQRPLPAGGCEGCRDQGG